MEDRDLALSESVKKIERLTKEIQETLCEIQNFMCGSVDVVPISLSDSNQNYSNETQLLNNHLNLKRLSFFRKDDK